MAEIPAVIISDVAAGQKDEVITSYNAVLASLKQESIGTTELNSTIEVESSKNNYNVSELSDLALNGFVYSDNPFLFLNRASDFKYLIDNPSYFKRILNQYFINNGYNSIIVLGNVKCHKSNRWQ